MQTGNPLSNSRRTATHPPLSAPQPRLPIRFGALLSHALDRALDVVSARAELSPRQRAVLRLVAMGYVHQEIAAELGITQRTVKMHVASLREKTGVTSRSGLLRLLFAA